MKTRSTPRSQPSAKPNLTSAKQSSQAWNSLATSFLCSYPKISWISICYSITLVTNRTQKIEKKTEPCIQGVIRLITKMFQITSHVITAISWKFHENLFIHFAVMLLTGTQAPSWKTMITTCIVPDTSWTFRENPFTSFSMILLSEKSIPGPIFPTKTHENPFIRLSVMLLLDTNFRAKTYDEILCAKD